MKKAVSPAASGKTAHLERVDTMNGNLAYRLESYLVYHSFVILSSCFGQ